jgi:trans-aconitate methyltransferase
MNIGSVFLVSILCLQSALASWNGADYQKSNDTQEKWTKSSIDDIQLRGDEAILDLGCGDGRLTKKLALRVPQGVVVGLDASASMIETAKTIVDEPARGKLTFVVGDAMNFSLEQRFDYVVSFTALHWVRDHDKVIERAATHLKPGGRIHLVFPVKWDNFAQMRATYDAVVKSQKYAQFFTSFEGKTHLQSLDDYLPRLVRNGLKLESMTLRPKETAFETREHFYAWLKGWLFAEFSNIPNELHDVFLNDFIDTYRAQPGAVDDAGRAHWFGYLLEVRAVRVIAR